MLKPPVPVPSGLSQKTAIFLDLASEQYQSTETLFSHVSKTRPRNQRLNYLRGAPFYGTFKRETGALSTPEDLWHIPTNQGREIGYARVSKTEQNLALQLDALKKRGVIHIFTNKQTGTRSDPRDYHHDSPLSQQGKGVP